MVKKSKSKIKSANFQDWILIGVIILVLLFAASFVFQDKLGRLMSINNQDVSKGELRSLPGSPSSSSSSSSSRCVPNCAGKECGSDGCGGSCGECAIRGLQWVCTPAQRCCVPFCFWDDRGITIPKDCGSDGCGGKCGPDRRECSLKFGNGRGPNCIRYGMQDCNGDPSGSYAPCDVGEQRDPRIGNCFGKQCGSDSCGGDCSLTMDQHPEQRCCGGKIFSIITQKCCKVQYPEYFNTLPLYALADINSQCPTHYEPIIGDKRIILSTQSSSISIASSESAPAGRINVGISSEFLATCTRFGWECGTAFSSECDDDNICTDREVNCGSCPTGKRCDRGKCV